jgi:hypothetical protein
MDRNLDEFIELYFPGYRNFSPGTKTAIAVVIIVGILLLLWLPIRSCSSSPPPVTGMYKISIAALNIFDGNGDKWELQPEIGQPANIYRKNEVKTGPPLLVKTDCIIKGYRVSIGLQVTGQADERYVPGAIKNGKREPPPSFIIIDEEEKVLDHGDFEYG